MSGTVATVKQYGAGSVVACAKVYDYGKAVGYLVRPDIRPSFESSLSEDERDRFFQAVQSLPEFDQAVHLQPLYGFDIQSESGRVFRVIDQADEVAFEDVILFLGKWFEVWASQASDE